MKKTLLLFALGLSALSLSAQTKFYLSGWGGTGKAGHSTGIFGVDATTNMKAEPAFTYNGGIAIGAEVKQWRVEAGLQYSTTGYKCTGISEATILPHPVPRPTWSVIYSHLSIPVRVGYVASVSKKLRVIPTATLMTSYNTGKKIEGEIPETYKPVTAMAQKVSFDPKYSGLNLWGGLGVNFEYSISERISAFAGPAFQFMLTGSDHPHVMGLNLGVNVKL